MAEEVIDYRFRLRRGMAATWTSLNDVLLVGEIGLEKDTGRTKIGDGTTPWNDLPYTGVPIADLGFSSPQAPEEVTDLDALTGTRFFAFDSDATGAPDTGAAYTATGIQLTGSAQRTQIACLSGDEMLKRTDDGSGWTEWAPLGGGVESVVAGDGIAVDDTDPKNPVVSSTLGSIALSGREPTYAGLPSTGLSSGDAYYVEGDDLIYIWNGSEWPAEGGGVTLRPPTDPYGYATTCLIQPKVSGLLDRALPGRWELLGDASMDPETGIDFGTSGFLYRSVPELVGAADFTVEGYWTPSSVSGTRELFAWSDGTQTGTGASIFSLFCEIVSGGKLRASLRNGSTTNVDVTTASVVVSAGTKYHIEVGVSGGTFALWVNGASVATAPVAGARGPQQSNLRFGQLSADNARQFAGKLHAFRVTSGVARHTSPFTPPPLPWPAP